MFLAGQLATSKPNTCFLRAATALPDYARTGSQAEYEDPHRDAKTCSPRLDADDLARLYAQSPGETKLVTEPELATPREEEWAAFANWRARHNPIDPAFTERLVALLEEDEEDEEGRLRPTDFAFGRAWHLIIEVSRHLPVPLPAGQPAADGEGGIGIRWTQGSRQLRLQIPARSGGPEYIYHKDDQQHGAEAEVSPVSLAGWLRWLAGDV
jgi:hypothetical protein